MKIMKVMKIMTVMTVMKVMKLMKLMKTQSRLIRLKRTIQKILSDKHGQCTAPKASLFFFVIKRNVVLIWKLGKEV
jgi:hypothetical protein